MRGEAIESSLRWAILIAVLVLSPALGYLGAWVIPALAALASVGFFLNRDAPPPRAGLPSGMTFGAYVLLLLLATGTANAPGDFVPLLGFCGLLFYAPVSALFYRDAGVDRVRRFADLAAAGALVALLTALAYRYVLGMPRAGEGALLTDPHRLSATALLLSVLPLSGIGFATGTRRRLYAVVPFAVLGVIVLTGSRAPLLGLPVLALCAAVLLIRRPAAAMLAAIAVVVATLGLALLADLRGDPGSTLRDMAIRLTTGSGPEDLGTSIRFILYRTGWLAFGEAPLFGHGWAHMMDAIAPHLGELERPYLTLPHLHDDALNFAVAAGMPGLIAWAAILLAPLVAALRTPRDRLFRVRLYASSALTIWALVLGLPDSMLSAPSTLALFVALSAIVNSWLRESPVA
jgi:O-antigen ligase